MALPPPPAWAHLPFFRDAYPGIAAKIAADTRTILPPEDHRFAALTACTPEQVKVVIFGQDPYPTPGHAHGFAFSTEPDVTPLPRSLGNIMKELDADLGLTLPNGDLRHWAAQGVLLLNTVLTVPAGEANGHARLGWQHLAEEIIAHLSDRPRAFILWGRQAQKLRPHIQGQHHLVIETAHPSPLSARHGFFGSRPFSRVNAWLMHQNENPIHWGPEGT